MSERASRVFGAISQGLQQFTQHRAQQEYAELEERRVEARMRLQSQLQSERDEADRGFRRELFGVEQSAAERRHAESMELDQRRVALAERSHDDTMQLTRDRDFRADIDAMSSGIDSQIDSLLRRRTQLSDMLMKGEVFGQEDAVNTQIQEIEQQVMGLQQQKTLGMFEQLRRARDDGASYLAGKSDYDLALRAGLQLEPVEDDAPQLAGSAGSTLEKPPARMPGQQPPGQGQQPTWLPEPTWQDEQGAAPQSPAGAQRDVISENFYPSPIDLARQSSRDAKQNNATLRIMSAARPVAERVRSALDAGGKQARGDIQKLMPLSPEQLQSIGFSEQHIQQLKRLFSQLQ